MKETVLVTGGAGYIGSHTAVELIQAGFDVVIADNLSNSDLQAVEGVRRITGAEVPFEQIDCCDLQAMRRLFERHEFRSVIHFAASKAVGESVAEPLKYYRNNLLSFLNVVELMCDFGRPNILFSSSCTVYGEPDAQPVTEQTPRKPATSPYGNTKQISEDILRDAVAAHPGLRGIALRYFNPIGSHPSALIGELPRGVPQNLVPYVTQTAAGIRECLSIFGNDYPTPDGTCIRDYIDIVDLARAHVAALHRLIEERRHPLRGLQRRHRTGRFGAGAGPRIRTGQRTETQLPLCAAPRRRHHGDLGRSHAGEHPPGLACRAAARRNAPHGLAMAAAPRTEITFPPTEHIAESASGAVPDALSAYSSLPFRHPAPTGPSHRTDRLPCTCKGFFHLFRNRKEKRLIFFVFLHQLGK